MPTQSRGHGTRYELAFHPLRQHLHNVGKRGSLGAIKTERRRHDFPRFAKNQPHDTAFKLLEKNSLAAKSFGPIDEQSMFTKNSASETSASTTNWRQRTDRIRRQRRLPVNPVF